MRKKTIIVNDIAATEAGAYTILKNFLEELTNHNASKKYRWIVFVSCEDLVRYSNDHIQVVNIASKNWLRRISWDLFGLPRWLSKNKIKAHRLFSIQNTGVPFLKAKQVVYIHQPLILARNIRLKPFEWKIKFYRWLYFYSVKWTIRKDSIIIVQTEWMKEELSKQMNIQRDQILIIKPKLNILIDQQKTTDKEKKSYIMFYPAVPIVSYKNHELLIKMSYELKALNEDLFSKIQLVFTVLPEFNKVTKYYQQLSKKLKVESKIKWKGYLNKEEMEYYYQKSDIFLFPSKLESFGLPLVEAAFRDKVICTLDTNFARELLRDYTNVQFISDSPKKCFLYPNSVLTVTSSCLP